MDRDCDEPLCVLPRHGEAITHLDHTGHAWLPEDGDDGCECCTPAAVVS